MIIGLIIMLLALFVGIGLIMNDILKNIRKMSDDLEYIIDTKFNLFGIVFCSNLFGILSVILLGLI